MKPLMLGLTDIERRRSGQVLTKYRRKPDAASIILKIIFWPCVAIQLYCLLKMVEILINQHV